VPEGGIDNTHQEAKIIIIIIIIKLGWLFNLFYSSKSPLGGQLQPERGVGGRLHIRRGGQIFNRRRT
jgi:hypothetical protein